MTTENVERAPHLGEAKPLPFLTREVINWIGEQHGYDVAASLAHMKSLLHGQATDPEWKYRQQGG